jgi:hypothetical protein
MIVRTSYDDWYEPDPIIVQHIEVDETDHPTGVLSPDGYMIYREPEPIGFDLKAKKMRMQ